MTDKFKKGQKQAPKPSESNPESKASKSTGGASSEKIKDVAKDLQANPYQEFFGQTSFSGDDNGRINYIVHKITSEADENLDEVEVVKAMRNISSKLGEPKLGQTKLDQIYRYVKIKSSLWDGLKELV